MATTSTGVDPNDWQKFGSDSGGGVGSVLGAYLANKAGLIDLKDPAQQTQLAKTGLMGTMLGNQLGITPTGSVPAPTIGAGGFGATVNPSIAPMSLAVNPQAARDTPVSFAGGNPNLPATPMDAWDTKYQGFTDKMKNFASMFTGGAQ